MNVGLVGHCLVGCFVGGLGAHWLNIILIIVVVIGLRIVRV